MAFAMVFDSARKKTIAYGGTGAQPGTLLGEDRERVVLFGGRLGWPNDANDTWEWDGSAWAEREP